MFGIGFTELFVIFVVVLLMYGPEELPAIARKVGKASAEIKKATDSVRREVYTAVYLPAAPAERPDAAMQPTLTKTEPISATEAPVVTSPEDKDVV